MARLDIDFAENSEMTASSLAAEDLFDLGMQYCTGIEVERNLITAHKWFNLAAMRGSIAARDYRKEISSEMTSDEIAIAQREAREWLNLSH